MSNSPVVSAKGADHPEEDAIPCDRGSVSGLFFQCAGHTYLVYVDRLSGWPCVSDMSGEATGRNLTSALREMFSYTGVPAVLRTDSGPQCTAGLTRRFLAKSGVKHEISSPHYSQAKYIKPR